MAKKFDFRNILVREPFRHVLPQGYLNHPVIRDGQVMVEPEDRLQYMVITQEDFLRQYYPSGHRINDPVAFPDVWRQDPVTKKYYPQPITRYSFAFQQVIKVKQVMHIVGNDIQMELADGEEGKGSERLMEVFRKAWIDMDMPVRFYEAVDGIKTVGDASVAFFMGKDGKARAKTMSFVNGDKLYPHYSMETGEMELFARRYASCDENGTEVTEYVDIWDKDRFYRAKRAKDGAGIVKMFKGVLGLDGYEVEDLGEHGFPFVPVAYHRERDGACWIHSQGAIEAYEELMSYFGENGKNNAFPLFYTKGDGVKVIGDFTGAAKRVDIYDTDGEAGYLKPGDVSASFTALLDRVYSHIYEGSFAVKAPEVRSGDLPGVAVKLLFSSAIEKATDDAEKLAPFLHQLVKMVKYAYGRQVEMPLTLPELRTNTWIEPYVHQNDSEIFANIAMAVQNGFLSRRTATERAPRYPKNNEMDRIIREDLERRKREAEFQMQAQEGGEP